MRTQILKSLAAGLLLAACAPVAHAAAAQQATRLTLDASAAGTPFPHFWEKIFGSGRAVLTLRDSYRRDLAAVKQVADFDYVRFHAIFHDEAGLYNEDAHGNVTYNFSYIDQIYDGLLENHVRPFVELSFMPRQLSTSPPVVHPFWYKPLVSPPKDWKRWDAMITAFARHLIERYGINEVAQWYFEVWNEPNIDFWAGDPKYETYLELYTHTARAVKAANSRLRVGGPSTAQAAWVDRFLRDLEQRQIPIDFASTHVYANDTADNVFGTKEDIPRDQMVCRAVKKVHDQIAASAHPNLPLIFSEYNASYMNEPEITDTVYMGPWMANTIRLCDGLVDVMAYWTFSDVFEEQGVVKTPFYGGFGLMAERNIPKPAYNAFGLLHRLGNRRLPLDSDSALATRTQEGKLEIALWNLVPAGGSGGEKTIRLHVENTAANSHARLWRVDADHGNVLKAFHAMGSPASPNAEQIAELRKAARQPMAEPIELQNGSVEISIPASGLVLLEIDK
ncbi:MAG: glycosyl hydrolase family 39 [Acidobacteria bacterium]|nr:glycosyl hydrolase family 39 [Acidobacteriota bacterium]